jgi:hypothetical protein
MESNKQSRGEKYIVQLMQELQPESERYRVLATAKQFKASWAELGERLVNVSQRSLFRDWGYESFDDYCSREIRIRKATAEKLTLAYRFLEREEPGLLTRNEGLQPLPDYRSIDLLRRAREEEGFAPEQYQELREAVIENERSHPLVRRQFAEVTRQREEAVTTRRRQVQTAHAAARRLESALLPLDELASRYLSLVEALLGELAEQELHLDAAESDSANQNG